MVKLPQMGKPKVSLPAKKNPLTVFDVVYENMESWGTVRRFLNRDVRDADIDGLLAAATMAHSTGDREPWDFIVVRDQDTRRQLALATEKQDWIAAAPVLLVVCANEKIASGVYGERGTKLYAVQDAAAAAQNILLAATAIGLATAWVGEFSEAKISLALQMPEWVRPQAIIAVGWPAEAPEKNVRHRIDDIVHEDSFGKTRRALTVWGHGH